MGYGLALAGGGTRGAAHVGVLKALMEAGVGPEGVAGAHRGGNGAGRFSAGGAGSPVGTGLVQLGQQGGRVAGAG